MTQWIVLTGIALCCAAYLRARRRAAQRHAGSHVAESSVTGAESLVTQLRTPLSSIRWMLERAADSQSLDEARSLTADAHASTQRLIGLLNNMADVTRLEGNVHPEPQRLFLDAIAADVIKELTRSAAAKHQTLTLTGRTPAALGDPALIRHAVLNLVSNAITYTPQGGTVHVLAEVVDGQVALRVRDTGMGIAASAQPHVFDKFYRADTARTIDTEGAGLGLYLTRLIAEGSGGRVTCESAEGAGSTFTFLLPAAARVKAAA